MKTFLVYFSWDQFLEIEAEEIHNYGSGVVGLLSDGQLVATFSYPQIIGIVEQGKIQASRAPVTRH